MLMGTRMAAATPPRLPALLPTSRKKGMDRALPRMYLWMASTRKLAMAASAMPDMASCPLGIFRLNRENTNKTTSKRPRSVNSSIIAAVTPFRLVVVMYNTTMREDLQIHSFCYRSSGDFQKIQRFHKPGRLEFVKKA